MEHPGPAGGVAEPFRGAGVPAQRDRRQPSPHGPSGPSSEPAARTPGPTARHAQTQSAPAQWYDGNTDSQTRLSVIITFRNASTLGSLHTTKC